MRQKRLFNSQSTGKEECTRKSKCSRPRGATDCSTPMEALDIVRRMAPRHGDDQIASVLNRFGYSTGKGKRWNQTRVATDRRNHSIAGKKRQLPDSRTSRLPEGA